jgi:hypothetical protein
MQSRILFSSLVSIAIFAAAESSSAEEMSATALIQDAFRLTTPAAVTRNLIVDTTDAMSVRVLAASATLSVTLSPPGGPSYTIGMPNTSTFSSEITPIQLVNGRRGASYLASITAPVRGNWTLSVRETANLNAPLEVIATVSLHNATQLVLAGGGDDFPAGNPIRLAAVMFDQSTKLSNVSLSGRLFRPFDPAFIPMAVVFRDDGTNGDEVAGDRIYQAMVNPVQPGSYQVQINATGVASTGSFRRTAATTLRVVPRNAEILDFYDDGYDDDFDGLYDRIEISPFADVKVAGIYTVSVRLRGANGREMLRTVEKELPSGVAFADVSFPAIDMARDLGVDGPYEVSEVAFLQLVGGDLVPADIRYDLGSTWTYQLTDLQHPRLRLSGEGRAEGVDQNGNGKFDVLAIELGVLVDFGGEYAGSASLTDTQGREIGFATGTVQLDEGLNSLLVVFDGSAIGERAVNGPYYLSNLILYGDGGSLIANTAFVTPFFAASQFEGFPDTRRRAVRH